jgi:hypothetical protein
VIGDLKPLEAEMVGDMELLQNSEVGIRLI